MKKLSKRKKAKYYEMVSESNQKAVAQLKEELKQLKNEFIEFKKEAFKFMFSNVIYGGKFDGWQYSIYLISLDEEYNYQYELRISRNGLKEQKLATARIERLRYKDGFFKTELLEFNVTEKYQHYGFGSLFIEIIADLEKEKGSCKLFGLCYKDVTEFYKRNCFKIKELETVSKFCKVLIEIK